LSAGLLAGIHPASPASAQAVTTDTPAPDPNQAYITNTFEGEPAINVRSGPSTTVYPFPCGQLPYGASAPATGVTPAREWVQIAFQECPGGLGWVYAANVTLTGALTVVEPPSTPTPLASATFDPTLVAAFQIEPTQIRLPTFTPPPPLTVPSFAESTPAAAGFPSGAIIVAAALLGSVVLGASFVARR